MMEYKGYHAAIRYSDEDNLFIGEVFGINDTLAFHGSSVQELESMRPLVFRPDEGAAAFLGGEHPETHRQPGLEGRRRFPRRQPLPVLRREGQLPEAGGIQPGNSVQFGMKLDFFGLFGYNHFREKEK